MDVQDKELIRTMSLEDYIKRSWNELCGNEPEKEEQSGKNYCALLFTAEGAREGTYPAVGTGRVSRFTQTMEIARKL